MVRAPAPAPAARGREGRGRAAGTPSPVDTHVLAKRQLVVVEVLNALFKALFQHPAGA